MATEPRARDPRYDAEKRERAAQLYMELGTIRAVATELDISVRRTWEILRDAGVELRPPGRPKGESE